MRVYVYMYVYNRYEVIKFPCNLHCVDDHDVYLLPLIVRTVESRARWMKKASNSYEVLVRKPA